MKQGILTEYYETFLNSKWSQSYSDNSRTRQSHWVEGNYRFLYVTDIKYLIKLINN